MKTLINEMLKTEIQVKCVHLLSFRQCSATLKPEITVAYREIQKQPFQFVSNSETHRTL